MTAPPRTYQPGDRVYRWVWVGGERADIQPLTVVRVNRLTVTVETDQGFQMRLHAGDIDGPATWEGEDI